MFGLWRCVYGIWVSYLLVSCELIGVLAKVCVYSQDSYNVFTYRSDQVLTSEDCQWGCCQTSSSPCCPVPTNLLVGVILGSVLIVAIVTAASCYHCVYRRNQPCRNLLLRLRHKQSASSLPASHQSAVFHSETSQNIAVGVVHRYSDDPPSYDEVMKGQVNAAFKSDARDNDHHSGS